MPAITAYIAISVWPLIILFLLKRFGLEKGILLGLLTAYMFLPAGFSINLPGIPAFNKFSVTVITLIAYLLLNGRGLGFLELPRMYKLILVWFLATPFLTAITNSNSYLQLPGLSYYDGLTDSVGQFLFVVPFMLGFKYFQTDDKHYLIFRYFAMAVLIYAILALYEIRMSPQLHNIVYGYFPHSWLQQVRSGGFRAIVFMGHGLLVALFLAIGLGFLAALKKKQAAILSTSDGNCDRDCNDHIGIDEKLGCIGLWAISLLYDLAGKYKACSSTLSDDSDNFLILSCDQCHGGFPSSETGEYCPKYQSGTSAVTGVQVQA
ncbi:hypothetical protein [Methylophaga lonarensis]|uniref:hypothetical protein n=1 Tax=Methylophaga lonarensis TaxID=999151 RepID=UPI000349AA37|nr:hypothetical protein [Methylophaga lonarensis]